MLKEGCSFREVIALILVSFFGWALWNNPTDDTIKGALLMAFAGAWGFYLGGSKTGTDTAAKNADTVSAQARAATETASGTPKPVTVANAADNPVPVETKP